MSNYRYLQLNKSNFQFFDSLLRGPCMSQYSSDNIALGQAIVDSFITVERQPIICMVGASNVYWSEKPVWLKDEPKWQHRSIMHNLHLGGYFRFEIQDKKVVAMTWFGYRMDLSQKQIEIVGRQVCTTELRVVLKDVKCYDARAQIIDDWSNMLSEYFNEKYGKL